ncbi:PPPDE putative peptidase domain containing protein [Nitzschia inconspicua]|uniref:PPPDE putative peptidase domain containing protein n=1 Tax=Nitzschia inconspicua TaxID=303405 RepID=A0A9K3PUF6_9STRA|nr:PPPDE putative peptidase domain containing protein [Nitzschia inconspicua]
MSQVQLVIYDLSHGMARQLSSQFLGGPQHAIDIIPHTAIVVFGREYFFGGGIQHEDPQQFRRMARMHPIQTLSLGTTSVSREEFEAWCVMATRNGRYTAASYDLLQRNCNNFSHEAAIEGLRLAQGVPEWILQVPQKFLSSPMGQLVRPMLENMQVSVGGGSETSAPFANTRTSTFDTPASAIASASATTVAASENPWADMGKSNGTITTTTTTTITKSDRTSERSIAFPKGTPTLDSFDKPLVSSDTKTVSLCVKKIVTSLPDVEDQTILQEIGTALSANAKEVSAAQVEVVCDIIYQKLLLPTGVDTKPHAPVTFVLMLLRVLVLQAAGPDGTETASSVSRCIDWICQHLQTSKDHSAVSATAGRAMAYLVLANVASLPGFHYKFPSNLMETSLLVDWSVAFQSRPEVRQAAAALAYNYVLTSPSFSEDTDDHVSDQLVSLVCASLEGLETEPDETTKLRRLLVAGRILQPVHGRTNTTIQSLMVELGFLDVLQNLVDLTVSVGGNVQCRSLARELMLLLRSTPGMVSP